MTLSKSLAGKFLVFRIRIPLSITLVLREGEVKLNLVLVVRVRNREGFVPQAPGDYSRSSGISSLVNS